MTKKCTGFLTYGIPAHDDVPCSEFHKNKKAKDGLQSQCKLCVKQKPISAVILGICCNHPAISVVAGAPCSKCSDNHSLRRIHNAQIGMCRSHSNIPSVIGKKCCQKCLDDQIDLSNSNVYGGFCRSHPKILTVLGKKRCQQCLNDESLRKRTNIENGMCRNHSLIPSVLGSQKCKLCIDGRSANERHRRSTDTNFRIIENLRSRTRSAIASVLNGSNIKAASTLELMGLASWDDLKPYLEPMLWTGMTWDNYGEWEIDHVAPIASFDKTNSQWQFKAFHYTNIQPLWAEHNGWKCDRFLTKTEWQYLGDLKATGWMPDRIKPQQEPSLAPL
jgi:hypothetical protein